MFAMGYAWNELRRRWSRTVVTAIGLAAGVGLVMGIVGVSDGLTQAQNKVLSPLSSVGTDIIVTRTVDATATFEQWFDHHDHHHGTHRWRGIRRPAAGAAAEGRLLRRRSRAGSRRRLGHRLAERLGPSGPAQCQLVGVDRPGQARSGRHPVHL